MSDGNTSYRLQQPGRSTRPGSLVFIDVQTNDVGRGQADPRCHLRTFRSAHVAACRWRRGHWTPTVRISFGGRLAAWDWIHSFAQTKGTTYVISQIASDCLTILDPWERLASAEPGGRPDDPTESGRDGQHRPVGAVVVRRMVLQGRPDIFQYSYGDKSVCWLSGRQYFDVETTDLRSMLAGNRAAGDRPDTDVLPELREHSDDELIWLEAMKKFADWFAGLNAGKFPKTIPNASMQYFRSYMRECKPVVHSDQEVISLERRAAHGGRASCWFFGDVLTSADVSDWPDWVTDTEERPRLRATATHFDIRSTYPTLLRDCLFPVRLRKFTRLHTPDDVRSLVRECGAVASVQLDTEVAEYPHRTGDAVIYPVGRFTSVLCGPELVRALDDGIVTHINEVAYYEMGRPFAAAADRVLGMRADAATAGDRVWELMVKLLANSLGGKLSQRPLGWVRSPQEDQPGRWGEDYGRNADTGATRKFRYINGLAFERREQESHNGTLLACFALLCSYCRYKMRLIRELLPARSVYTQDTDGLWVSGVAAGVLRNPQHALTGERPGELREVGRSRALRLLGPKHYRSDTGWVLAGYSKPQVHSNLRVSDCYTHNPLRTGTPEPPIGVERWVRTSELASVDPGGWVGPDGWVLPWRLPAETGDTRPPCQPLGGGGGGGLLG